MPTAAPTGHAAPTLLACGRRSATFAIRLTERLGGRCMSDVTPEPKKGVTTPGEQGARLAAEAAKRAAETAKAATEAVRSYLANSPGVGQRAFAAWAASTEAALKASFGMQNAAIEAGLPLSDATASGNREALQGWAEAMHQQQRGMLEAFHAAVHAGQGMADAGNPANTP